MITLLHDPVSLPPLQVAGLPPLDAVLITQSLEDHCHMKTLRELARARPTLLAIAPPSAKSKLEPLFKNVRRAEGRVYRPQCGQLCTPAV